MRFGYIAAIHELTVCGFLQEGSRAGAGENLTRPEPSNRSLATCRDGLVALVAPSSNPEVIGSIQDTGVGRKVWPPTPGTSAETTFPSGAHCMCSFRALGSRCVRLRTKGGLCIK